jgi:hypothetical protein
MELLRLLMQQQSMVSKVLSALVAVAVAVQELQMVRHQVWVLLVVVADCLEMETQEQSIQAVAEQVVVTQQLPQTVAMVAQEYVS